LTKFKQPLRASGFSLYYRTQQHQPYQTHIRFYSELRYQFLEGSLYANFLQIKKGFQTVSFETLAFVAPPEIKITKQFVEEK